MKTNYLFQTWQNLFLIWKRSAILYYGGTGAGESSVDGGMAAGNINNDPVTVSETQAEMDQRIANNRAAVSVRPIAPIDNWATPSVESMWTTPTYTSMDSGSSPQAAFMPFDTMSDIGPLNAMETIYTTGLGSIDYIERESIVFGSMSPAEALLLELTPAQIEYHREAMLSSYIDEDPFDTEDPGYKKTVMPGLIVEQGRSLNRPWHEDIYTAGKNILNRIWQYGILGKPMLGTDMPDMTPSAEEWKSMSWDEKKAYHTRHSDTQMDMFALGQSFVKFAANQQTLKAQADALREQTESQEKLAKEAKEWETKEKALDRAAEAHLIQMKNDFTERFWNQTHPMMQGDYEMPTPRTPRLPSGGSQGEPSVDPVSGPRGRSPAEVTASRVQQSDVTPS